MTSPKPGSQPDHAVHDAVLIARATAGDALTAAESTALTERLDACAACRALHADLLAVAASLRADMPPPRRPRDFRLSPSDAATVRGPSWRERLASILSGPALRPVAAAVCALGLVLAVGGTIVPRGGSALTAVSGEAAAPAAPSDDRAVALPRAVGGSGPSAAPSAGSDGNTAQLASPPAASPVDGGTVYGGQAHPTGLPVGTVPRGGAGDVTSSGIPPGVAPRAPGASGPDPWLVVSIVGVGLFALGLGGLLVARRRASASL